MVLPLENIKCCPLQAVARRRKTHPQKFYDPNINLLQALEQINAHVACRERLQTVLDQVPKEDSSHETFQWLARLEPPARAAAKLGTGQAKVFGRGPRAILQQHAEVLAGTWALLRLVWCMDTLRFSCPKERQRERKVSHGIFSKAWTWTRPSQPAGFPSKKPKRESCLPLTLDLAAPGANCGTSLRGAIFRDS